MGHEQIEDRYERISVNLALVDQFAAGIVDYHEVLKLQTGDPNPNIPVNDLFFDTDPSDHAELRQAIFEQTDHGWLLRPAIIGPGHASFVLTYEPDKFEYC